MKQCNIAVVGIGYIGLSIAILLTQHNRVTAVDVISEKVEKINKRISPIQDEYIEKNLAEKELYLTESTALARTSSPTKSSAWPGGTTRTRNTAPEKCHAPSASIAS